MALCTKCQRELPVSDIKFCPFCGERVNFNAAPVAETFTDERDGETYKLVQIGDQIWMAENLRFNPNAPAYDDDEDNVKNYGRFYSYDETQGANKVIPKGFHLPSEEDIQQLLDYVGANNNGEGVGVSLKSVKGWKYWAENPIDVETGSVKGTDRFGFRALPAGYAKKEQYGSSYEYRDLGRVTYFWLEDDGNAYSSIHDNTLFALSFDRLNRKPIENQNVIEGSRSNFKFSIRCVKDDLD